jgi:hypothetical protein
MPSVAVRTLRRGSLNIFALTAPSLMVRLLASMMLAGPASAICLSAVVSVCLSHLTCSISTEKTCAQCRSSRERRILKKLLRRKRSRILYLDHVEGDLEPAAHLGFVFKVLVQIRIVELKQYKRMRTVELFSRPERLPRLPALSPVGALAFRS